MSRTLNLTDIVPATAEDVAFWLGQFIEHALFLSKLLNPDVAPVLKHEAHELFMILNEDAKRSRFQYNENTLILLYALLLTVHNKIDDIPDLNIEISAKDFHDLVNHMLLEQTYFIRLVHNKVTVRDELLFWAQESAEHLTLVSDLLPEGDLKENVALLSDRANEIYSRGIAEPHILLELVNLLRDEMPASAEVYSAIIQGEVPVDRDMLLHERRESERALTRVELILSNLA